MHPRIGIGVLLFNDKNEILLGERLNAHGASSFGPPGGHLEFFESFEQCAVREVMEETGLSLSSCTMLGLTNDFFEDEQKHYVSIFMGVPYPVTQTPKNLEPHKTKTWDWYALNALPTPLFLPLQNFLKNGNEHRYSFGHIDETIRPQRIPPKKQDQKAA